MHDNKIRLSQDVLEKAAQIAELRGLKNARAAVEAVFRVYADDYVQGQAEGGVVMHRPLLATMPTRTHSSSPRSDAMLELDDILGM
jgi:hypothetical protein